MTANDAIVELQAMGYLFWIEGDHVAFALTRTTDRKDELPKERIRTLLQTLKENKDITMQLIELADQRRTTDERRRYLEAVMGSIWDETFRSVISEKNFKPSSETHAWETTVEQIWKDILRGTASLVDFRKAVHEWKKAGQTGPSLVNGSFQQ